MSTWALRSGSRDTVGQALNGVPFLPRGTTEPGRPRNPVIADAKDVHVSACTRHRGETSVLPKLLLAQHIPVVPRAFPEPPSTDDSVLAYGEDLHVFGIARNGRDTRGLTEPRVAQHIPVVPGAFPEPPSTDDSVLAHGEDLHVFGIARNGRDTRGLTEPRVAQHIPVVPRVFPEPLSTHDSILAYGEDLHVPGIARNGRKMGRLAEPSTTHGKWIEPAIIQIRHGVDDAGPSEIEQFHVVRVPGNRRCACHACLRRPRITEQEPQPAVVLERRAKVRPKDSKARVGLIPHRLLELAIPLAGHLTDLTHRRELCIHSHMLLVVLPRGVQRPLIRRSPHRPNGARRVRNLWNLLRAPALDKLGDGSRMVGAGAIRTHVPTGREQDRTALGGRLSSPAAAGEERHAAAPCGRPGEPPVEYGSDAPAISWSRAVEEWGLGSRRARQGGGAPLIPGATEEERSRHSSPGSQWSATWPCPTEPSALRAPVNVLRRSGFARSAGRRAHAAADRRGHDLQEDEPGRVGRAHVPAIGIEQLPGEEVDQEPDDE